jgi:hypothetical protein
MSNGESADMPNSRTMNTVLSTSRLMRCMTSTPAAVFAPFSDFMTKSEKLRKTPETTAQAMMEISRRVKNHVNVMAVSGQ